MIGRKVLVGLAITAFVIAVIAVVGWGYSTNWTFKRSA